MVAVERIEISRPVSLEIIDNRMKEIESETKRQRKILQKLRFVRLRYLGYTVPEACRIENISVQTGYNWQYQWNESGFDSLEPNYAGGRPASMTEEQKEKFFNAVARDQMTTTQAGHFIEQNYGIRFTPKHIREMLRKKGFRHAKPYDMDCRRPADAEATFKKDSEQPWIH